MAVFPIICIFFPTYSDSNIAAKIGPNESIQWTTDIAEFMLPNFNSLLFGNITKRLLPTSTLYNVFLPYICIPLAFMGYLKNRKATLPWVIIGVFFIVIAIGPVIKFAGNTYYLTGENGYMPYALLNSLPGFDFMRIPSRFMMMAYIGIGIASGFGLDWLIQKWPREKVIFIIATILFYLILIFPEPYPISKLPDTPMFYNNLAHDKETYGILDLPLTFGFKYSTEDSRPADIYQIYQLTHNKGIVIGYVSRPYYQIPILGEYFNLSEINSSEDDAPLSIKGVYINGEPALKFLNFEQNLVINNYKYVIWHKTIFYDSPNFNEINRQVKLLLYDVFHNREPFYDDETIEVYQVDQSLSTQLPKDSIHLGSNWYEDEGKWRWAFSPAKIIIESEKARTAILRIKFIQFINNGNNPELSNEGNMVLRDSNGILFSQEVNTTAIVDIPISLLPGKQEFELISLEGNVSFEKGSRQLSFAIESIDLVFTN